MHKIFSIFFLLFFTDVSAEQKIYSSKQLSNIFIKPSADSPIIYPIEIGKELILKDEKDEWVNVLDEKTGLVGWIQKELISENKPKNINSVKNYAESFEIFKGKVLEIREALQKQKRKIGPERGMDYSKLADHQLSDVWQYNIFPNVVLSFTPEHCWVLRPRPHPNDPSKCEFDKMSLVKFADKDAASDEAAILSPGRREGNQDAFLAEDYVRPNRDTFSYQAVINGNKTMTDTIDQDVELLSAVQQGMTSDGFDTVFLNEDEMRIQHFHNYINQAMG